MPRVSYKTYNADTDNLVEYRKMSTIREVSVDSEVTMRRGSIGMMHKDSLKKIKKPS